MEAPPRDAKPSTQQAARQADELFAAELFSNDTKCAPRTDDAVFLRMRPAQSTVWSEARSMNRWDWPIFWDNIFRIGAAAFLGGALGAEREWKGHWAGLRTHMMVAIGCAIFVVAGIDVAGEHHESVTRVIQGIASGIGFLGAGTILKLDQRQEIKGLTTASSIWLAAALGTIAGLAEYRLALAAAVISLFVLGVLGPLEKLFEHRQAAVRRERDAYDRKKVRRKQANE